MPELNLPTKAGQDEIKTLAGNINSNVDSVKADLTAVNTNVDSVNSNVNSIKSNVGSNSDASSATGSVHSKIKDVKASLGNTNDAANANGSINGKLRDLRATARGALSTKAFNMSFGSQTSYATGAVLSLTGPGVVSDFSGSFQNGTEIRVDGVAIGGSYYNGPVSMPFDIYFKNSFVVYKTYGYQGGYGNLRYALEA